MALVAYDNSDSSDYEDEENDAAPVVLLNNKPEGKHNALIYIKRLITTKLFVVVLIIL